LYGLFILLGAASVLSPNLSYIFPIGFLAYSCQKRRLLGLSLFAITLIYTKILYTFPSIGEEKITGEGHFHVDNLTVHASPFQHSYFFKGHLKHFATKDQKTWTHIPCSFHIPLKKQRPSANHDLLIQGSLVCKGDKTYILKPTSITPLETTFSMAEWRFQTKKRFTDWLKDSIPHKEACGFLTSMLTGDTDDRLLTLEFNRLGLQHILGVSGFQFVLLTSLAGFVFRLFLPYKIATCGLILFLTAYFLFLGDSPPVQRAWIGVTIFLMGILLNRRTTPLNALGAGLMISVLHEPLSILNIGFQLSFLCTLAILLIYPEIRSWMTDILPSRPFKEILGMSRWDRHGYILSALIRETLALNLAVHILALPALLCLFGKFPVLSLLYNLFIPFGATLVFIGSLFAISFTSLVPPLGVWIHHGNTHLTAFLLTISNNPPATFEFFIRAPVFPLSLAVVILTLIFGWVYRKAENRHSP
jgi:competence protein ComEC